jgi:peptide methionine sulfoxide reductase MsrB
MRYGKSHRVTPETRTECPVSGEYNDQAEPRIYMNIVSCEPLFSSLDTCERGCG